MKVVVEHIKEKISTGEYEVSCFVDSCGDLRWVINLTKDITIDHIFNKVTMKGVTYDDVFTSSDIGEITHSVNEMLELKEVCRQNEIQKKLGQYLGILEK
ncbi:hypothetical protein ASswx1_50 [Aeromonas phage Asswx_1]|uniref:Uncharacterized protein n=1 Tax=Aeromonas phage Asswx_1 TaxID=2419739 RepID=A0A411B7U9_9CAUD|nr:hypothetical protein ASswx1_50 [Aeromonas phage Asswx_1]